MVENTTNVLSQIIINVMYLVRKVIYTPLILVLMLSMISCAKKEELTVLTPKQQIMGYYRVIVIEQTAQSSQVGNTFELIVFENYCSGFVDTDSFLNLRFGAGAGLYPYDMCIPLNGYDIQITRDMNMDMYGAPISGEGTFENGYFEFDGIIHRSVGDFTFKLKSGTKLGQ